MSFQVLQKNCQKAKLLFCHNVTTVCLCGAFAAVTLFAFDL